ncbi:hypothetical protein EDD16DRAFT_1458952, partial [Pisolithus croceorrhizus]
EEVRRRCDYQNIIESYGQAVEDGYKWMRIDTYCIDKKSSAEPPEVINSMHRRHHNSIICRLYPRDVKGPALRTEQGSIVPKNLTTPKETQFFNKNCVSIGRKQGLTSTLGGIHEFQRRVRKTHRFQGVPTHGNVQASPIPFLWATNQKKMRVEDRVHSLSGLFDVTM